MSTTINFDSATVGALPSGWSNTGSAAFKVVTQGAVSSPNALGESTAVDGDIVMFNTAIGAGQSIRFPQVLQGSGSNLGVIGLFFGASADGQNGYLVFGAPTSGAINFDKRTSGSIGAGPGLNSGSTTFPTMAAGDTMWTAADTDGLGNFHFKFWKGGTTEPSWQATATDTTFAGQYAGGRVTLLGYSGGPISFDDFTYGPSAFVAPTGYTLTCSPTSVADGSPVTVTANLVGGTLLSSSLVITLADSVGGSTISGTITIASGSSSGSATINPSAAGTHNITGTHTGGGTGISDGSTSFTSTSASATSYTLTGPSSGLANNASAAFTVTPNGTFTGSITIATSGGGLGGGPIVKTFSGSSTPQTFTIDPTSAGTVTLTPTNSGSLTNPSAVTYAANAQTLSASPAAIPTNATTVVTLTAQGGHYTTTAPTFGTPTLAGITYGSVTVVDDNNATMPVTCGPVSGTFAFADSTTSATATVAVGNTVMVSTYADWGIGYANLTTPTVEVWLKGATSNSLVYAASSAGVLESKPGVSGHYSKRLPLVVGQEYFGFWQCGGTYPPPPVTDEFKTSQDVATVNGIAASPYSGFIASATGTTVTFLAGDPRATADLANQIIYCDSLGTSAIVSTTATTNPKEILGWTNVTPPDGTGYIMVPSPVAVLASGQVVASVTNPVTVGTNNDKDGYGLATPPPTLGQIAAAILATPAHPLATDPSGNVTAGTVADKAGYSSSSSGVDAILVESGMNLRQAISIILAALAGQVSGAGTGTVTIKSAGGTTTRISATTDVSGDRTSVTLSPPA